MSVFPRTQTTCTARGSSFRTCAFLITGLCGGAIVCYGATCNTGLGAWVDSLGENWRWDICTGFVANENRINRGAGVVAIYTDVGWGGTGLWQDGSLYYPDKDKGYWNFGWNSEEYYLWLHGRLKIDGDTPDARSLPGLQWSEWGLQRTSSDKVDVRIQTGAHTHRLAFTDVPVSDNACPDTPTWNDLNPVRTLSWVRPTGETSTIAHTYPCWQRAVLLGQSEQGAQAYCEKGPNVPPTGAYAGGGILVDHTLIDGYSLDWTHLQVRESLLTSSVSGGCPLNYPATYPTSTVGSTWSIVNTNQRDKANSANQYAPAGADLHSQLFTYGYNIPNWFSANSTCVETITQQMVIGQGGEFLPQNTYRTWTITYTFSADANAGVTTSVGKS